ncbi:ATP-grasp peptide maturase system methyltransferase [Allonocardiopsis opalescens]|uniref:Protein-L-isoaspartate O-methyltransferase n=1 Tax=Allonocardiopsis opalescens TaxID=1144618 RepID=A0A2T0Q9Y9_9ACTN|nr:ATP-grasp peptide maturase system methyltransferase [Allonocardiopsis opalescens]PRY00663.1 methyltransferase of ATP-grasp peptide maturase system [Allonocardiopsis opalescens]
MTHSTTDAAAELRRALAADLIERGEVRTGRWRDAVQEVPREVFLGEAVYRLTEDGSAWRPVRRDRLGEQEWLELAYQDVSWVTQVDGVDAADAMGDVVGSPTSSSTLPSLVVAMLEDMDIGAGQRVLEIGTGTGYSTALLCQALGDARVTSVEVDSGVAAAAAAALARVGHRPRLLVADGVLGDLDGLADDRRYDRLVATCSFRYLPPPWLDQVRPGGTILFTLSGWMHANAQALLTVTDDACAEGRFLTGHRSFMLARPHQPPPAGPLLYPPAGAERPSALGPEVLREPTARLLAQLAAPGAVAVATSRDVLLWDIASGSRTHVQPEDGGWRVRQSGPVRLWDQVEDAIRTWHDHGSPDISRFGLTATPAEQRLWLDSPQGPSWRLPI